MLEPAIAFLERLATQFSFAKLVLVSVIAAVAVGCIVWFESYTAHFELNKIERVVSVIDSIAEAKVKADGNKELEEVLRAAAGEAKEVLQRGQVGIELSPYQKKAIYALSPWFVFIVLTLLFAKKSQRVKGALGIFLIAVPLSVFTAWIPTFKAEYINYYLIPWGEFILIMSFILSYQKQKKRRVQNGAARD